MNQSDQYLSDVWKQLFPSRPYRGYEQVDVFTFFFQEQIGITSLFSGTAVMALVISIMGFMGLVSLNIGRRMKEFSIRKVLGATTGDVTGLITKEMLGVILGAILLAIPAGYYVLNLLFETAYVYHVDIGPLPFVLAGIILISISFLTMSTRIYTAARANPVESLHYE